MDVVPENFGLHDSVPFIAANLNDAFADRVDEAPEGIVAVEIPGHLENPRHFVRECYRALKPDGYLLLSTLNVDSPVSKSLFIRYGRIKYFDDDNYIGDGHILPISQWLLKKASEAGFAVRWLGTFGDPYKGMKWLSRTRLLALLVAALSPEEPKRLAGEILVLLAQKTSDSEP
jgi:SAM-dependent methyltransferase